MFSPLQTDIRPSRICRYTVYIAAVLSLFSIWISASAIVIKLSLSLAVICLMAYLLRRFVALNSPGSVITVRWLADRRHLTVMLADGSWVVVEKMDQCVIWPFLLAARIRLRDSEYRPALVIWRDSVSADQFRRLKVLLRFSYPGSIATRN